MSLAFATTTGAPTQITCLFLKIRPHQRRFTSLRVAAAAGRRIIGVSQFASTRFFHENVKPLKQQELLSVACRKSGGSRAVFDQKVFKIRAKADQPRATGLLSAAFSGEAGPVAPKVSRQASDATATHRPPSVRCAASAAASPADRELDGCWRPGWQDHPPYAHPVRPLVCVPPHARQPLSPAGRNSPRHCRG